MIFNMNAEYAVERKNQPQSTVVYVAHVINDHGSGKKLKALATVFGIVKF